MGDHEPESLPLKILARQAILLGQDYNLSFQQAVACCVPVDWESMYILCLRTL